jgi:hypothetical protein
MAKRLLFLFGLIFCAAGAHASVCTTLSSGASQSTIQSALNSCGSGNTVVLGAGAYGPISSTVTIPCGVSMTGPTVPYSQTPNQTATINATSGGISGGNWGFQINTSCSTPMSITYLAWNGMQPSVGGGWLFINPGVSNVTITNNWCHGQNAPGGDGSFNGYCIMMGGSGTNTISNITIEWNYFGVTSGTDCPSAMISGSPENDNGALCGAVAYQNQVSNIYIDNNISYGEEEPFKGAETQNAGWNCNNVHVDYNNVQNYNRIGYEEQCYIPGTSTLLYTQYNNWGNRYGQQQAYDVSDANGCSNSYASAAGMCETHTDYNVSVQAVSTPEVDVGFEIWGQGTNGCTTHCTTASWNLFQGQIYDGITWAQAGNFKFYNNTFNVINNGNNTSCIYSAGGGGYFHPENGAAFNCDNSVGNTYSNNVTGTYPSAAPTISPASGVYSGTVTITNTGTNRDTNTTDWCTTDGSTPAPGSGTSKPYYNGGTLTVSGSTTVKCVGMWGALNQPYSYPTNYGYVPSSVVSASYTACTNCVATPLVTVSGGTVTITDSTPGVGIWYTTDGSTPTLPPGGVPQGTTSSCSAAAGNCTYTPMCKPAVQPPLSSLKNITAYGAVAGGTDNTTAIVNACNAAGPAQAGGPAAQTSGIYIPAGVWYAGNFTVPGFQGATVGTPLDCNIYGQGPSSEIYCPNPVTNGVNCQMYSFGSNQVWSNFSHQMPFTTRDAAQFNISQAGGTNNLKDTLLLVGGNAGGFQNNSDTYGTTTNSGVFNTGADCNWHQATQNDIVDHTYIYNCGDDNISFASYVGQTNTENMLAQWNAAWYPPTGRYLTSGSNVTYQDNLIVGDGGISSGVAIYQQDFCYTPSDCTITQPISNVVIQYNDIVNSSGSEYNASIFLEAQSTTVSNILLLDNIISDNANRNGIGLNAGASGAANTISDMTITGNSIGTTGLSINNNSGVSSNVQCSNNTQNGSATSPNPPCGGTNPDVATGSSLSYSGCVIGTAVQYTGPFTASGTINAIAVRPGLTNSAIGSSSTGPAAATPTFSPASGTPFSGPTLSVTLSDSTPSSTIYYYTSAPPLVIVTTVGPSITDSNGYVWTITSGAQMAINGNVIPSTSDVVELVYVNGNVWQFNTADWYEVLSVTSPTVPTVTFSSGTTTSPIPTYSVYTGPLTLSNNTSISAYATAPGYSQSPIANATYTVPLTECFQGNSGSVNTLTVGQFVQQIPYCYYASVPITTNCSTPDAYGFAVTAWGAISGAAISVGAVGAGSGCSSSLQGAGCIKGVSAGSATSTVSVTGGVSCNNWSWTVSGGTPTLTGATMVVQSGGSTVYVGSNTTMCVDLAYTTTNTQQCGNGTDAYGTVVSGFASSSPSNATIVGSTGVLTGVSAGSTTVSASVNSGAYTPSLVVTVATPPVTPAAAMLGISGLQGNAGIQ